MQIFRHKEARPQRDERDIFTGVVESQGFVGEGLSSKVFLTLVRFNAGGRTKWHTHSFEQGLVIIEGRGVVATESEENVVEPGDVVYVAPQEKHWHGATETTAMAHIAINQPGETTVLEPVERMRIPNP